MFKKSLVWLLIVMTVLLMALPMTVFANEGDDTATVSDAGGESHEHTWVQDTNDADKILEYCTGCTFVKEETTGVQANIYGSKNGIPNINEEGNLVSALFDSGKGLTVTVKYKTPIAPKDGSYGNFTTTSSRMRLDSGATVTITYEGGEFDTIYWYMPLGYNPNNSSAGSNAAKKMLTEVRNGKFLTNLGVTSGATASFVNGANDAADSTLLPGSVKIELDQPVSEFSFTTASNSYYVANFKVDGTRVYDAGQNHPHTYAAPVTVAPSCYAEGYDSYVCEICDFEKKENVVPAIGAHNWIEGDCFTETVCSVCSASRGYNHAWIEDAVADNGVSHFCANCASYKAAIGVSPSNATGKTVTDEDGSVVQIYVENADKTMRLDAYPSATGVMPATNSNSIRMKKGTVGIISAAQGTFTEIDFYFNGNINGPFDDSHPANKGAKWALEQVEEGTFINWLDDVDSAIITYNVECDDSGKPNSVRVHVVLEVPVSELRFTSGNDNWYNVYIGVGNIIDVAGEHTHDFKPAEAPDCTDTVATNFVCADCGFGYAGELAPAGHTPGAAADCENDQTCTVCGDVLATKLGHSYGTDEYCSVCGAANPDAAFAAEVDGKKYLDFAAAYAAASAGQTIKLISNLTLTDTLNIDKDVTLDLNGNTVSGDFTASFGMIYVKKGATLTISGEGVIHATSSDAIGNYGTVIVNGGTITTDADPYYGAIYNFYYTATYYGTTVINGGNVDSILNSGDLTVNGGEIAYVDNSGKLAVAGGTVADIIAKDGADAEGVVGAGTIEIADTNAITVPEGYDLVEVEDGVYKVLAHVYESVVTAPDCVNGGYTTYTCVNCNHSYTANATEALGHDWLDATVEAPKTCTVCGATEGEPLAPATITGAKVNVGTDLAIKYHVYLPEGTDLANVILKVTNPGHNTYAELEGILLEGNTYVFVYDNIAPQCMSDKLDAELIIDGEVVATKIGYSIVDNAKNLAAEEDATDELKQFLADLLAYGQAAQKYLGATVAITDADIAAIGAAGTKAPDASITETDRVINQPADFDSAYISGAGVVFDNEIQIFVNVEGADAANAKVLFNGELYDVVDGVVYLPGMSITEISAPVVIDLQLDGATVHSITYGVYAYVYQMMAKEPGSAMANLAQALYNCAESAKAYID